MLYEIHIVIVMSREQFQYHGDLSSNISSTWFKILAQEAPCRSVITRDEQFNLLGVHFTQRPSVIVQLHPTQANQP